ncbi:phage holin family protein [Uliginosibacterium sp. H3]|uniref:Phage holin family protein n=1 Tax=Uliginosibacterium silvisoli TaxID=3114758 RepID=A0ABU6K893_9RHOO|nr:phage holin family protein [Uliginosibacterium sp. H3]
MLKLLARWALNALALMVLPALISSITVAGFVPALVAALVIGLLNALLRPILLILTLPVTIVSLGIFALVINGLLFWAASGLVPGVHIAGFWGAFWGAIVYSVLSWLVDMALGDARPQMRIGRN